MTALRFQTGGRHQTSLASLRGGHRRTETCCPCLATHNIHSTAAASITAVTLSLARTRHTRTEICCVHVLLHTTHTKAATNIMTDHPQHCLWPTGRSTLTNAGCVHVWLQHTLYTTAASIAADHPQHSLASRQGHID